MVTASPTESHPVAVFYSVQGTATLGVDYTLDGTPGQVVIPAGQSSATVHMHVAPLTGPTKGKTVKLALSTNGGYKMPKRGGKTATVTILGH